MDIKRIISSMTLEEKISYCTGFDFWHTKKLTEQEVPAIMMADGPHGLRCQRGESDMIGINKSVPATCFPTAVTAGATWNRSLYAEEGRAIGEEALANGVSIVLGPGCNIKRNPLGGRNFEYISEDPYVAGMMAAAFVNGLQSTGASASLKHFAVNSQETKRMNGDIRIDERALREIYLAAFEPAVRQGHPDTVMCAYNKINGVHCSDSRKLLTDILRDQWEFDGMVVTDWGALNDRIEGFRAGCDLNMPGGSQFMEKATLEAVKNGTLDEKHIDASVERILKLVDKASKLTDACNPDMEAHHNLACRIAEEGAVLLKNEGQILPADASQMVLIGYMAEEIRYQGTGSSQINPTKLVNVVDAMEDVPYVACCDAEGNITEIALENARKAAESAEIAVVFAGLPSSYESEAFDRDNMRIPEGHHKMIEAVADANPNTVVVLMGGSAMEIPWEDKVKAILYMGLPGQAGGTAVADLLTGKANPSGKLTETWPVSYDDVVSADTFGQRNPEYRESIYVGYRYYDKSGTPVRYPFGHGLSYTEFEYSDLNVEGEHISLTITNIGDRKGGEVVQLYVAPPCDISFRANKELKGFQKVFLEPGESKVVTFTLNKRSFALWNDGWRVPAGKYSILLGSSISDIRLKDTVNVEGEKITDSDLPGTGWYSNPVGRPDKEEWEKLMGTRIPATKPLKKGEFTMDNSCMEMKEHSLIMKIQYKVTENIVAKDFGGKKDMSDPAYRMNIICATDCPLRAVIINSGGVMNNSTAKGLLYMANGKFFRGLKCICSKEEDLRKK